VDLDRLSEEMTGFFMARAYRSPSPQPLYLVFRRWFATIA